MYYPQGEDEKETKLGHENLVTPMDRSLVKGSCKEMLIGSLTVGLFLQPAYERCSGSEGEVGPRERGCMVREEGSVPFMSPMRHYNETKMSPVLATRL